MNDIENHVREDIKSKFISNEENENFNIQTALVKKENTTSSEFEEIIPQNRDKNEKPPFGAFFECSYKKFKELTRSDIQYEVKVVKNEKGEVCDGYCKFMPNAIFVKRERDILNKIAKEYNITRPLIFSPYARKFASVTIYKKGYQRETIPGSEIKSIIIDKSACTDNLDCIKFTTDYQLVWNVIKNKVTVEPDKAKPQSTIIPKWMEEGYHSNYCFNGIQSNEFVLVNVTNDSDLVYLRENYNSEKNGNAEKIGNLYIFSQKNYSIENFLKYTLSKIHRDGVTVFGNYFSPNLFPVQRPRTKADIMSILSCFKGNKAFDIDIYISNSDEGNILEMYDNDYRYYNFKKNAEWLTFNVSDEKKYKCRLIFEGKDRVLTEDYARYVLEYISYMYPEINWQGEVKTKT